VRELVIAKPNDLAAFWRETKREADARFYDFTVVWHEQHHEIAVMNGERIEGALRLRVAASLGTIEALVVRPDVRRTGIGRALLARAEELANYYNCHKMTALVPHERGPAEPFLRACGYHVEAVLPQHTFKIDEAMMRKFLL
jgi:GNAT superfamily N-acetyltransferase